MPDGVDTPATRLETRVRTFASTFEDQLDQLTSAPNHPGNRTRLLCDGDASFSERERIIRGATHSINMQSYIFKDDATGWRIAQLLADRARAGVIVRIIVDDGSSADSDAPIWRFLADAHVQVRHLADPILRVNARWHEKNMVVDGRVAIQGGMNVADEYAESGGNWLSNWLRRPSSAGWHDIDLEVEGPAATEAQWDFIRNWAALGTPLTKEEERAELRPTLTFPNGAAARIVQNRPHDDGSHDIESMYVAAINEAQTSITIESAYFVPTPAIREALIAAARDRHVQVRVLTNSADASDLPTESIVGRYYYRELIEAGVEIFEMRTRMLHAKSATFDGAYSIVGSANLNYRAMRHDSETVIGTNDAIVARDLEAHFDRVALDVDTREAERITSETLDNDSFWLDFASWFLHLFVWFM